MKTILSLLFLSALALVAQVPPPPETETPATPQPPTISAPPVTSATNRDEAIRRFMRRGGLTNAPDTRLAPSAVQQVDPAAAGAATPNAATVPAPGTPGAAVPGGLAAPAPGDAPPPVTPAPAPQPEQIIPPGTIEFASADLKQVLKIYSELVGRTILQPANLASAPIILKTQTPLTKTEAIQALEAVLHLNGVSTINVGEKFVTIVPVAQSGTIAGRLNTNEAVQMPELGAFSTHIIQTKYLKPSELVQVLTPFASMGNAILPIDTSQILVLRDNVANVKRMLEMVAKVDVRVESEFISEVIPIRYALASEISSALNSLSGGGGSASVGRPAGGARTGTPGAAGGFNRPGTPGYNPSGALTPGGVTTPGATPGAAPGAASFSDRLNRIIQRASATGDLQIIGQTKIIADERTNSLLIFAQRTDMEMIKDIISKLDVVLAQVIIETLIMDVSVGDTWAVGVSASQAPQNFGPNAQGAGGYNNSQQFFNWLNSVTTNQFPGNTTGVLPPGFSYFARINEEWNVVLQAAAGDNRVKVIQKPRIQTSHATPASLFIGSTVPYVSSTYYGGGYAGGPSSSYQQLQVGIGINVTPFINQDGLVVMKIDEQISELDGSTPITGVGDVPNTKSSSLSAEIAVRDGESILLGGIMRDGEDKKNSGVPLLKDIPLLGYLFRSTSSTKKRQETLVMMRPTVLRTPELAAQLALEERKKLPALNQAMDEFERDQKKAEEKEAKRMAKQIEDDKKKALEEAK